VFANHHRHGHRFAEGAAEAEHDRADDAGARVEEGGTDGLESGGTERVRTLALRARDRLSTSRATDDVNGITMMARIRPAASMPTPSGGPLKIGRSLNVAGIEVSIARTAGTRTKMPQRP